MACWLRLPYGCRLGQFVGGGCGDQPDAPFAVTCASHRTIRGGGSTREPSEMCAEAQVVMTTSHHAEAHIWTPRWLLFLAALVALVPITGIAASMLLLEDSFSEAVRSPYLWTAEAAFVVGLTWDLYRRWRRKKTGGTEPA